MEIKTDSRVVYLDEMKKTFKKLVVALLARQVRALRKRHQFKIIGVAGSVGKTSTKLAIAQTLGQTLRVRYQNGNYNDIVSVPLVFFGEDMPSLMNPLAWIGILLRNSKQIRGIYPFDVVVVELGTDGPGQIAEFKKYLQLDIAVVTAIAPEHMEYFDSLEAVAQEELSVMQFAGRLFYNTDLLPEEARALLPPAAQSYGIEREDADYKLSNIFHSAAGLEGDVKHGGEIYLHIGREVIARAQLYSTLAAVVVSKDLGLKTSQITAGINMITPVSGRLRRLRGINNSVIIDDTYNASPDAVKAGLEMLYELEAPQKIAVLGNMNELGSMSAAAHKEIGELCDQSKLNLVVTLGPDANAYLAPAAEAKGCVVKAFTDPYTAGEYLQGKIEAGAFIFAKGSQNGVFAEEVIKKLLADPEDANKLVRQSSKWLKKKQAQFGDKQGAR